MISDIQSVPLRYLLALNDWGSHWIESPLFEVNEY